VVKYTFKAHATLYSGVAFRSRLEARWAAFFDLAKLKWQYEPYDLNGWTPDFLLTIPCSHSECFGKHDLLVEIKPFSEIEQFKGHPCMDYPYGIDSESVPENPVHIPADASAAFGNDVNNTFFEMAHGAGGGSFDINYFINDSKELWIEAGNMVQWKPRPIKPRGMPILPPKPAPRLISTWTRPCSSMGELCP
jgi:hypothetical protein